MGGPLTVADVLDRAADLIEPEGKWTQHHFTILRGGRKCFCALGAIADSCGRSALSVDWDGKSLPAQAAASLRRVIETPCIDEWNDDPERTQAEVVAKLREAAAISRALPGGEGK